MEFVTNFLDVVVMEILSKLLTFPHSLQVEESHSRVETLQPPDISMLSPGVFFPVLIENSSVVRRHVLSQAEQLGRPELIKLLVETE